MDLSSPQNRGLVEVCSAQKYKEPNFAIRVGSNCMCRGTNAMRERVCVTSVVCIHNYVFMMDYDKWSETTSHFIAHIKHVKTLL